MAITDGLGSLQAAGHQAEPGEDGSSRGRAHRSGCRGQGQAASTAAPRAPPQSWANGLSCGTACPLTGEAA